MVEDIAKAAQQNQLTITNVSNTLENEKSKIDEEIEKAESDRKAAIVQAKKSIMKDPDLSDDQKVASIEGLSQTTRWTLVAKIFAGFSVTSLFNTAVYLLIIFWLTNR